MDLEATVADAVERIAQLSERSFLARSPLHLARCGGCAGPTFQQPCPLCSFYPMGADKGSWHPARASREFFCEKVAASAPAGTGNLATWVMAQANRSVAYRELPRFRHMAEEASAQASALDMPDAGLVYDLVATGGISVRRERPPHDAGAFWEVVAAIRSSAAWEAEMSRIGEAVEVLHAGSFEAACSRLREALQEVPPDAGQPSSELRRALETLDRIAPTEETADQATPRF